MNVINLTTWFLIDLIPISTIFFLHWRNYRKESQKQSALSTHDATQGLDETRLSAFSIKHNWEASENEEGQYSTVMLTLADQKNASPKFQTEVAIAPGFSLVEQPFSENYWDDQNDEYSVHMEGTREQEEETMTYPLLSQRTEPAQKRVGSLPKDGDLMRLPTILEESFKHASNKHQSAGRSQLVTKRANKISFGARLRQPSKFFSKRENFYRSDTFQQEEAAKAHSHLSSNPMISLKMFRHCRSLSIKEKDLFDHRRSRNRSLHDSAMKQ